MPTIASIVNESVGLASSFHPGSLHITNSWLIDSAATSSMNGDHSVFSQTGVQSDLRMGVRFILTGWVLYDSCRTAVTTLLYMVSYTSHRCPQTASRPKDSFVSIATSALRSAIFPQHRWVNRHTRSTDYTATIRSDGLAYLDWVPSPSLASANVTICELHSRLNDSLALLCTSAFASR